MTRALLLAALSVAALAACDNKQASTPVEPAKFIGLSYGSGSFTQSPDACAISILYDTFAKDWLEADRANPAPDRQEAQTMFGLIATPAARAGAVAIDVRGHYTGPGKQPGTLTLMSGAETQAIEIPNTGASEGFVHTFQIKLNAAADVTPVELKLALPRPPADSKEFEIAMSVESLDLKLNMPTGVKPCGAF